MSGPTRLQVLHCGTMFADRDLVVTGDPAVMLTRDRRHAQRQMIDLPSFSYVIHHPDGNILVDTSITPDWVTKWPEPYQILAPYDDHGPDKYLEARLNQIGVRPESFRYVILTHLHCDHSGNISLFRKAGSQIIVHEDELKGVLSLPSDEHFFIKTDVAGGPLSFTTVYGDFELLPGVHIIAAPGHTWGSMAILVQLPRTNVLLTGDAIHTHFNYGPPDIGSMLSLAPDKWPGTVQKLRGIATKHNALIIHGHDHTATATHCAPVEFTPDGQPKAKHERVRVATEGQYYD